MILSRANTNLKPTRGQGKLNSHETTLIRYQLPFCLGPNLMNSLQAFIYNYFMKSLVLITNVVKFNLIMLVS